MLFELDRIKAKKIYYKRILLKQIVKDTSKANSKKNEKIYIICLCFLMFFSEVFYLFRIFFVIGL
jgi:hypothetical protein